jgi:16S rRNA U1498 N3-methylase RsmE
LIRLGETLSARYCGKNDQGLIMRTPRIFSDQPLLAGAELVLNENAAQYLGKVLRARIGDDVILFDGQGQQTTASIQAIGKQSISVLLGAINTPQTEPSLQSHLGLCLSKGDRFDWAIQKATELGVSAISPLYSARVDFTCPTRTTGKAPRPLAANCAQRLRTIRAGAYSLPLTRPPH